MIRLVSIAMFCFSIISLFDISFFVLLLCKCTCIYLYSNLALVLVMINISWTVAYAQFLLIFLPCAYYSAHLMRIQLNNHFTIWPGRCWSKACQLLLCCWCYGNNLYCIVLHLATYTNSFVFFFSYTLKACELNIYTWFMSQNHRQKTHKHLTSQQRLKISTSRT